MTDFDLSGVLMAGYLKQQIVGSTGLYAWIGNKFSLQRCNDGIVVLMATAFHCVNDIGTFADITTDIDIEPRARVTLSSIKYAKEWNFVGASGSSLGGSGFGFDLLFTSGRLWSFLADSESECKAWVDTINAHLPQQLRTPPTSMTSLSTDTTANSSAATTTATNTALTFTAPVTSLAASGDSKNFPSSSSSSKLRLKNEPKILLQQYSAYYCKPAVTESLAHVTTAANKLVKTTTESHLQSHVTQNVSCTQSYPASPMPIEESGAKTHTLSGPGVPPTLAVGHSVTPLSTDVTANSTILSPQTERELSQLRAQVQAMSSELLAYPRGGYAAPRNDSVVPSSTVDRCSNTSGSINPDREVTLLEHELTTLRQSFAERERDTAADLTRLEDLHERRVKAIAQALLTERKESDRVKAALEDSRLTAMELERKLVRLTTENTEQLKRYAAATRGRQTQVSDANGRERDARLREESYRAQLTEQLESNQLLRAECEELRKQVESSRAEALLLRTVRGGRPEEDPYPSNRLGESAREVSLQIARAEAALLEQETHRLAAANIDLTQSLDKYEQVLRGRTKVTLNRVATSGSANTQKNSADSMPTGRSQTTFRPAKNILRSGKPVVDEVKKSLKGIGHRTTTSTPSTRQAPFTLLYTSPVAYKWRAGCCRSPVRCGASSLLILPDDIAAVPVTAYESPSLRSDSQLSLSYLASDQGTTREVGHVTGLSHTVGEMSASSTWSAHMNQDVMSKCQSSSPVRHSNSSAMLIRPAVSTVEGGGLSTRTSFPDMPLVGYY